jgi:hypothetical protein
MYQIPVLFVFFNRPEISKKAFQSIRECRPSKLYLACDGPREKVKGERELVEQLRSDICSMVDWDCEVHKLFQEKNVGCGPNVYASISWLFQNEERGIVLEDDCIAEPSFFPYMESLLSEYENDLRIGMITGTNPVSKYVSEYSYMFSRFKNCWGWATWRSAWEKMDYNMDWRKTSLAQSVVNNSGFNGKDNHRWRWQQQYIDNGWVSAWDWQWYFSLAAQNQLCVFPKYNLISNIGNDANATHNASGNITFTTRQLEFPLTHPPLVVPDVAFEKLMYKNTSPLGRRINRHIPHKLKEIKNKIMSIFK